MLLGRIFAPCFHVRVRMRRFAAGGLFGTARSCKRFRPAIALRGAATRFRSYCLTSRSKRRAREPCPLSSLGGQLRVPRGVSSRSRAPSLSPLRIWRHFGWRRRDWDGNSSGRVHSSTILMDEQKPIILNDIEKETRFPDIVERARSYRVRSMCLLPLSSPRRRLGVLGFRDHPSEEL